jgi:hypothetical protein
LNRKGGGTGSRGRAFLQCGRLECSQAQVTSTRSRLANHALHGERRESHFRGISVEKWGNFERGGVGRPRSVHAIEGGSVLVSSLFCGGRSGSTAVRPPFPFPRLFAYLNNCYHRPSGVARSCRASVRVTRYSRHTEASAPHFFLGDSPCCVVVFPMPLLLLFAILPTTVILRPQAEESLVLQDPALRSG